jgi:hypothetical protein
MGAARRRRLGAEIAFSKIERNIKGHRARPDSFHLLLSVATKYNQNSHIRHRTEIPARTTLLQRHRIRTMLFSRCAYVVVHLRRRVKLSLYGI